MLSVQSHQGGPEVHLDLNSIRHFHHADRWLIQVCRRTNENQLRSDKGHGRDYLFALCLKHAMVPGCHLRDHSIRKHVVPSRQADAVEHWVALRDIAFETACSVDYGPCTLQG